MVGFRWSGRREQAALLVAEDRLTNAEIAAKVGVSRQALDKWKADPEFRERVRANVEQLRHAVLEVGIHDRSCRVAALEDRLRRLPAVVTVSTWGVIRVPVPDHLPFGPSLSASLACYN